MSILYFDAAGVTTGRNKDPDAIVFACVIIKNSVCPKVENRRRDLIASLEKRNFVSWRNFEFKAHDILQGAKDKDVDWRQLDEKQRNHLLKQIKAIILELKLPAAIVLIDMHEDWKSGQRNLSYIMNGINTKIMDNKTKDKITTDMKPYEKGQRIKDEPFGNIIGLLFGLANGLLYERKIVEHNESIADEQYVKENKIWGLTFSELLIYGRTLVQLAAPYFGVKKEYKPDWYISDQFSDNASYECFGLQLADYTAYISRRKWIKPDEDIKSLSVFKQHQIVKLQFQGNNYPGIYVGICNNRLFDLNEILSQRTRPWIKRQGFASY